MLIFALAYWGRNFSFVFWELKKSKSPFEINWPLKVKSLALRYWLGRHSEKATQIWNYLPLDLTFLSKHQIKWKIVSSFVAFSEKLNFISHNVTSTKNDRQIDLIVNFIIIFWRIFWRSDTIKDPKCRHCAKNKGVNRWLVKLLGFRLIITAEDSLWDQRFWKDLFLGGGCSLSGGLGLCKGDSCSGIKGPQFLECSSLLAPFCDSGVRMSGWSSASNITPWRCCLWWFMMLEKHNDHSDPFFYLHCYKVYFHYFHYKNKNDEVFMSHFVVIQRMMKFSCHTLLSLWHRSNELCFTARNLNSTIQLWGSEKIS